MTTNDRSEFADSSPREDSPVLRPGEIASDAAPAREGAQPRDASAIDAPVRAEPARQDAPSAPLTDVTDGLWHSLSHDYIKVQRISGVFGLLMVFPPLIFLPFLVGFVRGLPWLAYSIPLAIGAIFVFLLWVTWVYASLHHKHARYRVDDKQIEWAHGVWWRKVTIVPRTRVQHTDVSQGPLERRFGLGTLHIYTAGTENAKVPINGLEHEKAARIRDHLVQTGAGDAV